MILLRFPLTPHGTRMSASGRTAARRHRRLRRPAVPVVVPGLQIRPRRPAIREQRFVPGGSRWSSAVFGPAIRSALPIRQGRSSALQRLMETPFTHRSLAPRSLRNACPQRPALHGRAVCRRTVDSGARRTAVNHIGAVRWSLHPGIPRAKPFIFDSGKRVGPLRPTRSCSSSSTARSRSGRRHSGTVDRTVDFGRRGNFGPGRECASIKDC